MKKIKNFMGTLCCIFVFNVQAGIWIPLPFDLVSGSMGVNNARFKTPVENHIEQCVRELFVQTLVQVEDDRLHLIADNDEMNWKLMDRNRMIFLRSNVKYINTTPMAPDIPQMETIKTVYSFQGQLSDQDFIDFQQSRLPLNDIIPMKNWAIGNRTNHTYKFEGSSSFTTVSDRFKFQVRPRYENASPHALTFKIEGNVRLMHVIYENLMSRSIHNPDNKYRGLYCELDQRVTHNIGESFYKIYDVIGGYNESNTIIIDGQKVRQSLDVEEKDYWFNSLDVLDLLRNSMVEDQSILNFSVYEGGERLVYPRQKNIPYQYKRPVTRDESGKTLGDRMIKAIQTCDSEVRDLDVEDSNAFVFNLSEQTNEPFIGRVGNFRN